jgi:hypothetical protein
VSLDHTWSALLIEGDDATARTDDIEMAWPGT